MTSTNPIEIDLEDNDSQPQFSNASFMRILSRCAAGKTGWLQYATVPNEPYLKWLCSDERTSAKPMPTPTRVSSFDICSKQVRRAHPDIAAACRSYGDKFRSALNPQPSLNAPIPTPTNARSNVYTWNSNSCWVDSVIMVILMGASDYIRKAIFNSNPSATFYKRLMSLDIIKFQCANKTPLSLKAWAVAFQSSLREDYDALLKSPSTVRYCTNTRRAIFSCIADSEYGFGTSDKLYELIAAMFPVLLFKVETIIETLDKNHLDSPTYTKKVAYKYVDALEAGSHFIGNTKQGLVDVLGENTQMIIKKSITRLAQRPPVVVLRLNAWHAYMTASNKGSVNLLDPKSFGALLPELKGRSAKIPGYTLYATVVSKPVSAHWVAYFRPFDNPVQWMYYDGMGKRYEALKSGSQQPWTSSKNHIVSLVFFQRNDISK